MSHADRPPKTRRDRPSRSSPSRRRRSDRRASYPFELAVDASPGRSEPDSADEARRALDEALADLDRVFREPAERAGAREPGEASERAERRDPGVADGDGGDEGWTEREPRAAPEPGTAPASSGAASADRDDVPAGVSFPVVAPAPLGERRPGWRRVAYPLVAAACVVGLLALLRPGGPEAGGADAVAEARTAAVIPAWTLRGGGPAAPERDGLAASPLRPFAASALDDLAASSLGDLAAFSLGEPAGSALGDLAGAPGPEAPEVAPYWLRPAGDDRPAPAPVPAAPSLRLRLAEPSPGALEAELSGVDDVARAAVARPLEGSAVGAEGASPAERERAAAGRAPREPYDVLPRPRRLEAFRDRVSALAGRAFRLDEDRVLELEATIGPEGRVQHVQTVGSTGVRDLDFAIMELVRDLEFSPALRDGEPVEAVIKWPITLRGRDHEDEDGDRR